MFSSYIAPVTWNCYGVGVVFCTNRRGVMDRDLDQALAVGTLYAVATCEIHPTGAARSHGDCSFCGSRGSWLLCADSLLYDSPDFAGQLDLVCDYCLDVEGGVGRVRGPA